MIIIFPLSHEKSIVKRIPVITLTLIILNVIIYGLTLVTAPETTENLIEKEYALSKYYFNRPYLKMPESTLSKLHPDIQEKLKQGTHLIPVRYQMDEQQAKLDIKIEEFEKAFEEDFYRKYGYIPARGGLFPLISSCFLHGGFLHLLFNMIFLFLSGYIIEDYWGRILFSMFYLCGGMAAGLTHAYMFPNSYVPLIGASGAIAALMGAFLIRFYKTRIYFFYFILIIIRVRYGRFLAPAFIILPLWLIQQIFFALTGGESGGVAFWAHIGGFAFGIYFAIFMKLFRVEEKIIAPELEKKVCVYNSELLDEDETLAQLTKLSKKAPDNGFVRSEKSRTLLNKGDVKLALYECRRAIVLYMKEGDYDEVMDYYTEMSGTFQHLSLKYDYQIKLIELFESEKKYKEAAMACKNLVYYSNELNERSSAIDALFKYGDICFIHLGRVDLALKVWQQLLTAYKGHLTVEQRETLKNNLTKAKKRSEQQASAVQSMEQIESIQEKKVSENTVKLIEELAEKKGIYDVKFLEPRMVNRVRPGQKGLILEGAATKPVLYKNIYAVCAYKVFGENDMMVDIFLKGELRPYRVASGRISYPDFFNKPYSNVTENFRQFIKLILSSTKSVYTNIETSGFIENKKIKLFASYMKVAVYEKDFWAKLKNDLRYICDKCLYIMWIDSDENQHMVCGNCENDMSEL